MRTLDLERNASAARRARLFVAAACSEWDLDAIRGDAVVVVSELVANAVLHAGTGCRVALRYRAHGLTVAVYDTNPGRVLPLRPVTENQRGHGLFIVAAMSLHWGVTRGVEEKCVWAFLPVTAAATYPAEVRKAAHDAARAALTHGADSPTTALAVRRLVQRLADERGPEFLRDMADELVAELAEASAATATEDGHRWPQPR
jgi:anti-sigma regulatory factor (Ser/Thr protein kinase)